MYNDTPTRCPLCGYIISRIRTIHFLTKNSMELDRTGNIDEEIVKLLVKIEELRERIAKL